MNKTDVITKVAEKTGFTKKDSEAALAAFQDVITEALVSGERVQMTGFGTFEVTQRAGREGRNPLTGESLYIAPTKAPKFKAGKLLKTAVNV